MSTRKVDRIPVEIPAQFGVISATLEADVLGLTPLLMHNPGQMQRGGGAQKSGKNIPTPEEEAERGTYRLKGGQLHLPAHAVQRAMIEAAVQFKDPTYPKQTLKKPLAASLLPPDEEGYGLFDPDTGEALHDYEIDVRRAVVQRQGVMRARPRIDRWAATLVIPFDAGAAIPVEMIATCLATAGSKVGVLDYRPESGGYFGRFEITAAAVVMED